MKPYGEWINPDDGYDIVKNIKLSKWYRTIYNYQENPTSPLMFRDINGWDWRPSPKFTTDQGSVPAIINMFILKDRFLGFYLHDDAYRMHGLSVDRHDGYGWIFQKLSRIQIDDMLADMCRADPDKPWILICPAIWIGVRIGGWMAWDDDKDERDRFKATGKDILK